MRGFMFTGSSADSPVSRNEMDQLGVLKMTQRLMFWLLRHCCVVTGG